MAHKKAAGSTRLGRDSMAQRLGVKIFGGQKVESGQIIIRQRGNKYRPGNGVRQGGDDTLYAVHGGVVKFAKRKIRAFTGKLHQATFVSVDQK